MGLKADSPTSTRPRPRYEHLRANANAQTPSPSWRESFKLSCLERARRNRDRYIKAKRQSARELIEEELEESGVMIGESRKRKEPEELHEENYCLSEDEVYELMQEVEEELQRDEERILEELEQLERYEEQFRHLVADYDDWEGIMDSDVLCPICKEVNLILDGSTVICPNLVSGHCNLRLATPSETYTLSSLREQLAVVFEDHAVCCPGSLELYVRQGLYRDNEHASPALVAQCHSCEATSVIL